MTTPTARFTPFVRDVSSVDPALAAIIQQIEESWRTGDARDGELTEVVTSMLEGGIEQGLFTLSSMIRGYKTFAHDFQERQLEFLCSGRYRATDYEQVSRDVYLNDEFMRTVYYPALLFSYLAAPNYRHLLRRLDDTLGEWRDGGVTRVLEVGAGHAFLLLFALHRLPGAVGVGTDISPVAGGVARALQGVTGWAAGRFDFAVLDVLESAPSVTGDAFDAAICCELLEHVPAPGRFLRAIHERLKPGGRLFVSAAVRMDAVDHLTLFESTAKVRALLAETGFEVASEMSVPFVTRRPLDAARWQKLLHNPHSAATFVAECRKAP
jgi:SAM-dependent methyltransferase